MNTVTDGCCIIDALRGIDTATAQISQFSDNFSKIKFIIGKNLDEYTIMILTDIDGQVEFVITDGENLIKTINEQGSETSLLWNIGREITAQSGVITYQIVAYKGDSESPDETWYSKEGRLKVNQSIDSIQHSTAVIGSYPNLLTKLILEVEKVREDTLGLSQCKVDKEEGMGLSGNDFSDDLKEKLEGVEEGAQVNVKSDWTQEDTSMDSYIENKPSNFASFCVVNDEISHFEFKGDDIPLALIQSEGIKLSVTDRPDERSVAISNIVDKDYDPESQNSQSGTAVAQGISQAIEKLAGTAPEALDTLSELANALNNNPDFGNAVMAELLKKADTLSLSPVATSGSYGDLTGKPELSQVATSGSYGDLTGKPELSEVATSGSYGDLTDKPELSEVATSGSYEDLTDKPNIIHNYADLLNIPVIKGEADILPYAYFKVGDASGKNYGVYTFSQFEEYYDDTSGIKDRVYTRTIIDVNGIRRIRKLDSDSPDVSYDWIEIPLNANILNKSDLVHDIDNISGDDELNAAPSARAVKIHTSLVANNVIGYVDTSIGDIETSLENIIAKYGLGGESV